MQYSAASAPVLTVVVPAYNEATRLPASLERIGTFLGRADDLLPAEIVVVDDGSGDDTATVAGRCPLPPGVVLHVHRHPVNRGKGAAVRTGFGHSRGDAALVSDADLATPIGELRTLLAAADPASVVIGSRALDRRLIAVSQPWYRDLMGRTFNLAVRTLAVPGVHDTQCGFKLVPGAVARDLARVLRIDGFAWDVELLLVARRWGLAVREVPVAWSHVEASRVSPVRHSAEMMLDLLGLAVRRLLGTLPRRPVDGSGGKT